MRMRIDINNEVWVAEEQGAVHIRAASLGRDPAELTEEEAEKLIAALQEVVRYIRTNDL